MASEPSPDFTLLLDAARGGDQQAQSNLIDLAYRQLRSLAQGYMRRERVEHTLQPTALVNEALMRIMKDSYVDAANRTHFFALAARVMKNVLVDHERGRRAGKRGSGGIKVPLDGIGAQGAVVEEDILVVNDLLGALSAKDPLAAQVFEMKFFAGLDNEQIAEALGKTVDQVRRKTTLARSWLKVHMEPRK